MSPITAQLFEHQLAQEKKARSFWNGKIFSNVAENVYREAKARLISERDSLSASDADFEVLDAWFEYRRENKYVALKICAIRKGQRREAEVMRALAKSHREHPRSQHVIQMLDLFKIAGPNGQHDCFVFELHGQDLEEYFERRFSRLPASVAKRIAKGALQALDYLHKRGIVHGDVRTGTMAFTLPAMDHLGEEEFCEALGGINTSEVLRRDGKPLDPGIPKYIMEPARFPQSLDMPSQPIKIVNFGEAFPSNEKPPKNINVERISRGQAIVQAPEVTFGDLLDHRMDLWSMDRWQLMETLDRISREIPESWQEEWQAFKKQRRMFREEDYVKEYHRIYENTVAHELRKSYFDEHYDEDEADVFSMKDINRVSKLIERLMRLEPSERASAAEILADPWWDDVPSSSA
ncbi:kinase-like domain-containing protein [Phyllosticta citribraziliensis]